MTPITTPEIKDNTSLGMRAPSAEAIKTIYISPNDRTTDIARIEFNHFINIERPRAPALPPKPLNVYGLGIMFFNTLTVLQANRPLLYNSVAAFFNNDLFNNNSVLSC